MLVAGGAARAQSPVGQPTAGSPSATRDSLGASQADERAAAADTASRHEPVVKRFDQPRWVMLRSLVVPGWGQASNGSWTKAVILGSGEIALATAALADNRELDRLREQIDVGTGDLDTQNALIDRYNHRLNLLNTHEWLLGGVIVYALVDAYVDANFKHFRAEFETDRALPRGPRPGRPTGARVSLEWAF
ncbi:MAG TPA: DUF5683 domain-containing protein [Candidatus Eisenbacteria bacterium]|nr:DUF5683 domain-containing protein [Candidatus Eisenbacteria bacterium]